MAEEKTTEQEKLEIEKVKLEIEKVKLGYTRARLVIEIFGLAFMTIGLVSTGLIANFFTLLVVLAFLSIIFIGILFSLSPTERGQSIDWDRALLSLEKIRRRVEILKRWGGKEKSHPIFDETYYSYLRRLYLHAIREGRKDFAEELWKKGQLSKKE